MNKLLTLQSNLDYVYDAVFYAINILEKERERN